MKKYGILAAIVAVSLITVTGLSGVEPLLFKASTLEENIVAVDTDEEDAEETQKESKRDTGIHHWGIRSLADLILYEQSPELFVPKQPSKKKGRSIQTLMDLILFDKSPELFKSSEPEFETVALDIVKDKETINALLDQTQKYANLLGSKKYDQAAKLLSTTLNTELATLVDSAKASDVAEKSKITFLTELGVYSLAKGNIEEAYKKEGRQIIVVKSRYANKATVACVAMVKQSTWKIADFASRNYFNNTLEQMIEEVKAECEAE